MHKGKYQIILTNHAIIRATQRQIEADIIEQTISTGKIRKVGKGRVIIEKRFKNYCIRCVDEIAQGTITIFTVTKSVRR